MAQPMSSGMKVGDVDVFEAGTEKRPGDHFTVAIAREEGESQDSDLMEKIPAKRVKSDSATDDIQLVSLGCSCAPKMSFKELGRGAETLPFDWSRSTMKGVYQHMTTHFTDFFNFTTRHVVDLEDGNHMVMFRSEEFSFWHDDPTVGGMQERYRRRFARFNSLK